MMNDYLMTLALAALPALGNFLGGLLAEFFRTSQRTLSIALHGAAGVVLAVVAVELMPQALKAASPWIIILAFLAGGGLFKGTRFKRHAGGVDQPKEKRKG
ncbi:MAG: hypothetical protein WAO55_02285 [Candidatus Manganitrophaceae bacterium]